MQKIDLDEKDPWSKFLSIVTFVIEITIYMVTRSIPIYLVFRCDAILNIKHYTDWNYIKNKNRN